jgi:hypothetical protein
LLLVNRFRLLLLDLGLRLQLLPLSLDQSMAGSSLAENASAKKSSDDT